MQCIRLLDDSRTNAVRLGFSWHPKSSKVAAAWCSRQLPNQQVLPQLQPTYRLACVGYLSGTLVVRRPLRAASTDQHRRA